MSLFSRLLGRMVRSPRLASPLPSEFTIIKALRGVPYHGMFLGPNGAVSDRWLSARAFLFAVRDGAVMADAIALHFLPGEAEVVARLLGCDDATMRKAIASSLGV